MSTRNDQPGAAPRTYDRRPHTPWLARFVGTNSRQHTQAAGAIAWILLAPACAEPGDDRVFTERQLASEFTEVLPCRFSHDHLLRSVRVVANDAARPLYERCVLPGVPCDEPFPVGAAFVKLEYDLGPCIDGDLVGYTASIRLEDGASADGHDWRWLEFDRNLAIIDDGAPPACLRCHIDHCAPPNGVGHELRCTPD